jgi:mono/diheme cytochrome c family protein
MKTLILFVVCAAAIFAQGKSGASPEGDAANGKKLFLADGCYQCHGYAGQGGRAGARIGPPVLNAAGVIRYVRRPTGQMPAFTEKVISDQELTDIYAYLKTFPAAAPAKDIPLLDSLRR